MPREARSLPGVGAVPIRLIMEHPVDRLMPSTEVARRHPLGPNPFEHPQPMAEHGFSALIEVRDGEKRGTVLCDSGVSRTGILHNMDVMEIAAQDIQAIVLSHGHAD